MAAWGMGLLSFMLVCGTVWGQPVCSVVGHDSVFFDKVQYNAYLPGSFIVSVTVFNPNTASVDSVVVFARSNQRFTVVAPATKLIADTLRPGDTVRTEFTLIVNPRDVSGVDTVTVAVSGKAGARSSCLLPIWVEKEYRPLNVIICPPDSAQRIVFLDTLNAYVPDPIAVPISVINNGDAPSKETRIMYVATPGIAPADGQDPILDVGTLGALGGRVQRIFLLRPVRRSTDTVVTLRFRVQGKGGLGDRIIDTLCASAIGIPPVRDVAFELQCLNDVAIRFDSGRYTPNPFSWSARVRNSGNAVAKNVRVFITLPPFCELDSGGQAEIALGLMPPGDERTVSWLLRAKPVDRADTGVICVRVLDEFNRTATCCDSITIPPVRRARVTALCVVTPDSIRIDTRTGGYQPAEFEVRLSLQNEGTESADSVVAELSLSDPDIAFVAPVTPRQLVAVQLAPQAFATATWRLAPLPSAVERTVAATVRLRAAGHADVVSQCTVHIAAALIPALQCEASTVPADTLHFDPGTFVHDPLTITATVRNTGTIGARSVQATVLLPSYLSLAAGEMPVKMHPSPTLPPDSSWTVAWRLLPLRQQTGVLDSITVEFRGEGVRTLCDDWVFVVGIPPLTVMRIPAHFVERYGQRLKIPVHIDNTDRKSIREMDVAITYDSTKVAFLGFDLDRSMLDSGWVFQSLSQPGRIRFAASSADRYLAGEGALVRMDFLVTFGYGADQLRVSGTTLAFDSAASSVNRGAVRARFYDGFLWTSGDCLWPLDASDKYLVVTAKPNPFNPSTTIRYVLPEEGRVRLRVYDLHGRLVAELADGMRSSGAHEVAFDGRYSATGMYVAVLEAGGVVKALRVMLTK